MIIPINRNTLLVFAVSGFLMSIFGFYYYFSSTKYNLVSLNGTLISFGKSNFNGKEGNDSFEFRIKERNIRFQTGQLSYKYFKKTLFDSFGVSGSQVSFEINQKDAEKIDKGLVNPSENVWIYSLRDEKYVYLSLEDTKKSDLENKKYALYVAIAFLISSALLLWHRTTLRA